MPRSRVRHETRVRPARPSDIPSLARVRVESWHSTYRGLIAPHNLERIDLRRSLARFRAHFERRGPSLLHVLEAAQGVVGFANSGPSEEPDLRGEVWELYLLPSAQGHGDGRRLLGAALWALAGVGGIPSGVWVLSDNHRARRFYERMGGVELRSEPVQVGDQELSKTLYGWLDTLPWPEGGP